MIYIWKCMIQKRVGVIVMNLRPGISSFSLLQNKLNMNFYSSLLDNLDVEEL